ncbi:MAG: acyl carrier protein [Planctomycetes bacterium]|nr:acyl carrier protein [Planctomycetota bacterium]
MQNCCIKQTRDFIIDNFLYGDGDGLANNTSFMVEGIIDSTGILELITFLEMTYQIKIADAEIIPENMDCLESIEKYLVSKLTFRSA